LDGVYTAEQAARGVALYRKHCTYCHHDDLLGGEDLRVVPPALVGIAFSEKWLGKTVANYYEVLSTTMPWERAKLTPPAYADITGYLLKENGYPAGRVELPPDAEQLARIRIAPAP
jgi:mono/diheme cytochrome c family protein